MTTHAQSEARSFICLLLMSAVLAACGGGEDDSGPVAGTPAPSPAPAPAPKPPAAPAPSPAPAPAGDPSNDIRFNPCPPAGTPCNVMTLGDSITAGFKSSKGPYNNYIAPMIAADGKSLRFMGGVGYPGFTIMPGGGRQGISDFVIQDMKDAKPNVITLMIGTNDVDIQLDLDNAPARLGKLLDQIAAYDPNVLTIVAKIVPQGGVGADERVQRFNAGLPAVIKERQDAGKRIWLVDMHAAFVASPNWKTELMDADGLHPNDAGFDVMAAVWYSALKRLD